MAPKVIGREDIEQKRRQSGPHRLSFLYTRPNEPKPDKEGSNFAGTFTVPFPDTVQFLFEQDTALKLFPSKYDSNARWRSLKTSDEFEKTRQWVSRQRPRIFLRDTLDLSVALDQNFFNNEGEYTPLGEAEQQAKHQGDLEAIKAVADAMTDTIRDLPGYRDAQYIAAVPAHRDKPYDLPTLLAARLARMLDLEDLTHDFTYRHAKPSLKSCEIGQKWDALAESGLRFTGHILDSKPVILVDDKYQSGFTLQFVASCLQAAGAGAVYGLCAVKTLNDTDNM